jgi:hypothetical protein
MQKTSKNILRSCLKVLSVGFLAMFTIMALMGYFDVASASLASGFAFSSIDWEGGDNIGGFTSEAFLGLHHEIDTFPALKENPANDEELVTLEGSYTMKESKHFVRIYVTPRTFGMEAENQGEIDGKSFVSKGEFFYPGGREEAVALARKINNARGIIIGIDPNTGKRVQIGSREFPCHFSPKLNFGNEPTSRRGLTVEFEADGFVPATFYPGAIPLSEGDVPAQS